MSAPLGLRGGLHTWTVLLVQSTLLLMSEMGILVRCGGTCLGGPAPSDRRWTGMLSGQPEEEQPEDVMKVT